MSTGPGGEFLAADVYPIWRRRVKAAASSIRIYAPYLDRLAVDLLGHTHLDADHLAVVTDLSPASGTLDYRGQLLAIKRLLDAGVDVRSLPRLHAKVLLVDGETTTVGSQNFTSYARRSRETTHVSTLDLRESTFVATLQHWYSEAERVDPVLVARLLDELDEPFKRAKEAITALVGAYEDVEATHREERRQAVIRRFERDLAIARSTSTSSEIRRAAVGSGYSAGQSVAYASLEWHDDGYKTLMRWGRDIDLTSWRRTHGGTALDPVRLERLAFYPVLLGPEGRMALVRVARSRITYVWRGVRWGAAQVIGGHRVYLQATFPDDQADGANLILAIGWDEGAPTGYQLRLRFDGERVLPVAEGGLVGRPSNGDVLARLVTSAYEDEEAWDEVLREVFSPADRPRGFLNEKNASSFFPTGWLRIDHTKFLDQSVLLIQPNS